MEFRLQPQGFTEFFAKQQSSDSQENERNRKLKNTVKIPLGFCRNLYV